MRTKRFETIALSLFCFVGVSRARRVLSPFLAAKKRRVSCGEMTKATRARTTGTALLTAVLLLAVGVVGTPMRAADFVSRLDESPYTMDQLKFRAARNPRDAAAQCELAEAYLAEGDAESAFPILERALANDAHCARALVDRSLAFQQQRKMDKALADAKAAIAQNDKKVLVKAHLQRIALLRELRRDSEAVDDYRFLLAANDPKMGPGDRMLMASELGEIYLKGNDLKAALALLKPYPETKHVRAELLRVRATLYARLHNNDAALLNYDLALKSLARWRSPLRADEEKALVLKGRAKLYDEMGKHQLADADRKAIKRLATDAYKFVPFRSTSD